ncbi:MAG: hypothetical protein M1812_000337 [Candelaria pacifica]|nr:MAG: hypothetical protein M1812_000337 [Candelaria pacifica]
MEDYVRQVASRPMNVEQIVQKAQDFDYNPLIPLKYWLRTADTLLKEARIYEREGNEQQAYLLLYRHAQLVVKYLASHPDARSHENRLALVEAKTAVQKSLAKLEVLRPRINKRFERYEELLQERDARRQSAARKGEHQFNGSLPRPESSQFLSKKVFDPAMAGAVRPLAAEDNRDLAVELAHKEIKRRQTARKATRQAGISEEEEHERRTAGLWGDWEEALARDSNPANGDDLSRRLQETRRRIDEPVNAEKVRGRRSSHQDHRRTESPAYDYPPVPKKSAYELWIPNPIPPSATKQPPTKGILKPLKPPELPPKPLPPPPPYHEALPPRPDKAPLPDSTAASPTQTDLQPSGFTFKPSAYLENGTPLRTIFLPPELRSTFLSIASLNTRANLETCGMLCGTLISNALFVSKLVIPDQESTSDTCETINESALFDYCDSEDLMILGWIHTHPSQTCFMSSRDLHTHCGYQVMMPESIAIVCAPSKQPSWGVFRLTDPPGMKSILNCRQTGLFHPHEEGNIYTDALRPGHVFEAKGLEFEVMDLRPGH